MSVLRRQLLRREREEQYKHHRAWKQAFDEFQAWMSTVREKVPAVRQRSFGDRSAIEGAVAALDVSGVTRRTPESGRVAKHEADLNVTELNPLKHRTSVTCGQSLLGSAAT